MTPKQAARLVKKHGSIKAAARAANLNGTATFHAIRKAYNEAVKLGIAPKRTAANNLGAATIGKIPVNQSQSKRHKLPVGYLKPKRVRRIGTGKKRYHLFTCAQNNTAVHPEFWRNLIAFKKYLGADLHVARITYKKQGFKAHPTKESLYGGEDLWWAPEVVPYIDDTRLDVAPKLRWCGDMDILPTATRPLSDLWSYTGRSSGIFPHPKIALESVPGGKNDPTKLIMTTGAVTLRNYIQRKTGMKADFHHCFAALLVEVDEDGFWFPRQINADSTGTFYDLDRRVKDGKVTENHRVEAIYWADPQIVEESRELIKCAFGRGGMKDCLRPKRDFMGDVGSFKSRSHWDQKDPYKRYLRHVQGLGDVRAEAQLIKNFLWLAQRSWCETNILDGNHERHIGRWLRENNAMMDPLNAEVWAEMQAETLRYIKKYQDEPNFLEILLKTTAERLPPLKFRHRDESVILCKDAGGGIECGEHGDDGIHGSRGSTASHAKGGRKKCLGHAVAQIYDGIYRASSFSRAGLDWAHGNTAMNTCASVIIYPNGKRTLNFIYDCNGRAKWRA